MHGFPGCAWGLFILATHLFLFVQPSTLRAALVWRTLSGRIPASGLSRV